MSLTEAMKDEAVRAKVVDDCVVLVDAEVKKKKGLGGMVIKAGYKAVNGIKPGFIRKVVDKLFDEWAAKLDPFWKQAIADGTKPRTHLESNRSRVAEALLSVTDAKVDGAESKVVRGTYKKLRPSAKDHVESAVPGLAAVLERHTA